MSHHHHAGHRTGKARSGHGHPGGDHAPVEFGSAFALAVALNLIYVLVEAGFGFLSGSLALLADAAHNLTDVAGLLLAWGASALGQRSPSAHHTYGLGRASILAALVNGAALMVAVGALSWEALWRFSSPVEVPGFTVLWVAMLGIAINTGTALLFIKGRKSDLNIEGAFLHMAADAVVSGAVVISALVMLATGWQWIDPLAALMVSAVIAWSSFGLLRSAIHLGLDGVPEGIDRRAVEQRLAQLPGVSSVHDLHIWALSTTTVAMTVHLVMPAGAPGDGFLSKVAADLEQEFGIGHVTIQIERGDNEACLQAPDDVV